MNLVNIYCLINPLDESVFYVGATFHKIYNRLSCYKGGKGNRSLKEIVKIIQANSMQPEILLLDEVSIKDASFFEDFYMDLFKSFGFKLCNIRRSDYSISRDNGCFYL